MKARTVGAWRVHPSGELTSAEDPQLEWDISLWNPYRRRPRLCDWSRAWATNLSCVRLRRSVLPTRWHEQRLTHDSLDRRTFHAAVRLVGPL